MNWLEIVVILQSLAIILGIVWARFMILKAKRELILTKEEFHLSMKAIETDIMKLKKDMIKHVNYHEKYDSE